MVAATAPKKISATFRIPMTLFRLIKRIAVNEDVTYSVVAERWLRIGLRQEREARQTADGASDS